MVEGFKLRLAIMLVIVLPTIAATLAFAWWFRGANPRAQYRPDWVYSGRIELLVWGIPLLVIMFLGGVIWIGSHELDPFRPIASQSSRRLWGGTLVAMPTAIPSAPFSKNSGTLPGSTW